MNFFGVLNFCKMKTGKATEHRTDKKMNRCINREPTKINYSSLFGSFRYIFWNKVGIDHLRLYCVKKKVTHVKLGVPSIKKKVKLGV